MALRSLAADRCTADYLRSHPRATVVALAGVSRPASGASTPPDAQFRWVSIDLPPVIALREKLLPSSERISAIAQSALDYSWMDRIDVSEGVFITAEGLLMYLQPSRPWI